MTVPVPPATVAELAKRHGMLCRELGELQLTRLSEQPHMVSSKDSSGVERLRERMVTDMPAAKPKEAEPVQPKKLRRRRAPGQNKEPTDSASPRALFPGASDIRLASSEPPGPVAETEPELVRAKEAQGPGASAHDSWVRRRKGPATGSASRGQGGRSRGR